MNEVDNDDQGKEKINTTHLPPSPQSQSKPKTKIQTLAFIGILLIVGALASWFLLATNPKIISEKKPNPKKEIPKLTVINQGLKNEIYPSLVSSDYSYVFNFQIFEALVRYEDQTNIVPGLATSWTNPDELTWRFTLKKNVKFHTGRTMTADDVVYSYEQAKKNEFLNDLYLNTIESVKKISPQIVEIKTIQSDPVILNKLSFMHIIDSKGSSEPSPLNGTGPYTLKKGTIPSAKKIELVAFDDYHQGRPLTRSLTFIEAEEDKVLANALLEKKANIAGEFNAKSSDLLDKKRFIKREISDTAVTFLVPNTINPGPLQKLEVRQAIQYALDVPALIKANDISATPYSQLIAEAIPGYNPSIKLVDRDIQKAKDLLIKAGYGNGFEIEFPDVSEYYNMTKTEFPKQLNEIGIRIKNTPQTGFDEYIDNIINGKVELGILSYASDTFDGADILNATTSQLGTYKSDKLQALIDEASKTSDPKKRLEILQEANMFANKDLPVIPLFSRTKTWYMDKNYNIKRDMPGAGMGVYFWKVHQ